MKKLLLVALFVAIPALVLAQANPSTTTKTEVKKTESTTTTKATEPTKEAAKTETKKTETATTTKTNETMKTATTTPTTPEMVLIGEITTVDSANKSFTLKVKDTNKEEKISFKETNPTLKSGSKVKAVYEKDASGKLWLKKLEEHTYTK